jgi:phenylacetate-CoA ligase
MATQCPSGGLHIPVEGMTLEIVERPGEPEGERGEIVVSNAHSFAMPIIRYRTGDIGALEGKPCACGRALPCLRSVEGRRTDFLVTPDGRVMHALAAIYPLRETPGIQQFQVVQERLDLLRVVIVRNDLFTGAVAATLVGSLKNLFGGDVSIELELVDTIPPLPSGKHRYVISKVADRFLEGVLETRA